LAYLREKLIVYRLKESPHQDAEYLVPALAGEERWGRERGGELPCVDMEKLDNLFFLLKRGILAQRRIM